VSSNCSLVACALSREPHSCRASPVAIARARKRPPVEERYPTFEDYDAKVKAAMTKMIQDRTMLCEDGSAELLRLRRETRARQLN